MPKPALHRAAPGQRLLRWLAAAAVLTQAGLVHGAGDEMQYGVAVIAGYGRSAASSVSIYGIAAEWAPSCACDWLKEHGLDARLVGQLAYWRGLDRPTPHGSLWDTSLTPVFRWLAPDGGLVRIFVDGGVGIHLLSSTYINNDIQFATAFQFGEQIGAGMRFGDHGRYELGVYFQHVSNANIKRPNTGLTYLNGVFRTTFE